ncbi:DUF2179 domain-containing protein [bacterium]|nr:DUF2179 domain-containing protein [bacterium]
MSFLASIKGSEWGFIIMPLLIFFARILDVSVGTIRVIFVSKGYRALATILGFFEVLIWITAMGQIMGDLNNGWYFFAYAAGFAAGNFVGITIEKKISLGVVILRVITQKNADELVKYLRSENYGVTLIDAEGAEGTVKVIFMVMKRQKLSVVIPIIKKFNPNAFFSIEDVRYVREGTFPQDKKTRTFFNLIRK